MPSRENGASCFLDFAMTMRLRENPVQVIGVPSNDFSQQEPGDTDEVASFCEINYGVELPIMEKVHVREPGCAPAISQIRGRKRPLLPPALDFCKYRIGRDGYLNHRYASRPSLPRRRFERAVLYGWRADSLNFKRLGRRGSTALN
jgi:glutathione peroxidase